MSAEHRCPAMTTPLFKARDVLNEHLCECTLQKWHNGNHVCKCGVTWNRTPNAERLP